MTSASHRNYHPEGEVASRRGAATADALPVMSTLGSSTLAEVGAASDSPWWFQLYVQADLGFTERLVMQAVEALNQKGITLIVVTHDAEMSRRARRNVRMRDGKIVEDVQRR